MIDPTAKSMDYEAKYAAFESWGRWTVQRFVGTNGGEIVAEFSGEGYDVNKRKAHELVAKLNAA